LKIRLRLPRQFENTEKSNAFPGVRGEVGQKSAIPPILVLLFNNFGGLTKPDGFCQPSATV
jgi:hypothetical protein